MKAFKDADQEFRRNGWLETQVPGFYSVKVHSSPFKFISNPVGLKNVGLTCWFNVVIQLLYHIPKFRKAILRCKCNWTSHNSILALQEIFKSLRFSPEKSINPQVAYESIGKLLENSYHPQDASEYLAVLLENIGVVMPQTVESLFKGSFTFNIPRQSFDDEQFLLYSIQVNSDSPNNLSSCLKAQLSKSNSDNTAENQMPLFSHLPPVFLIEFSRVHPSTSSEFVKDNHLVKFPSVIFMDRFMVQNKEKMSNMDTAENFYHSLEPYYLSIQNYLKNIPKAIRNINACCSKYQSTTRTTAVDFERIVSLNEMMKEKVLAIKLLEESANSVLTKMKWVIASQMSTVRPYQLHAVVVHRGGNSYGHYYIYVWSNDHQCWFEIDDDTSTKVTWNSISEAAFGGREDECSASCLIYIDTLEAHSLLEMDKDYAVGCLGALSYLKSPADLRTRHAAYAKSQTFKAVLNTESDDQSKPSSQLFKALDYEQRRLHSILEEWDEEAIDNEVRLQHFVVYLFANCVDFEPYGYWTLLQHFSISVFQANRRTRDVCIAARHNLAFLENSSLEDEKILFIIWNNCYHKFRLVARHVMAAVTEISNQNFAGAVSLALKAFNIHLYLMRYSAAEKDIKAANPEKLSLKPFILHSLIEKSLTLLSDHLLGLDLTTIEDIACTVLFDGIIYWCENADTDGYSIVAESAARLITVKWQQRAEMFESLAEVRSKIQSVNSILDSPPKTDSNTQFDFKCHISDSDDDGNQLAQKWSHAIRNAMEQNLIYQQNDPVSTNSSSDVSG